ncbi:MAG: oligosaccharide flippase family protein [Gammaproteobacteria bacterium]|nr:oligosaccharide flippase family protein [Gammaproteobacteria bacterium]MBU1722256.1 oligosaccharide flippase family protein [Gammaproteobacteria bacterium]MBU2005363.1 oligosaccharide flippase family protein [Gammaproteobacteria bacterium]
MRQSYSISALIRLVAIALNAIGALVLLPFILKSLGEYHFGIWGMASSITGYLLLLDLGIAMACTRYLSMQAHEAKSWNAIISNSLALSLAVTGLLVIAVIVTQILLHTGLISPANATLTNVVSIVMVEVALSIPLRMYQSILRAEVRYTDIGLFEIVRIVLRVGGIFVALLLGAGLLEIVLLSSCANTLFFLLPMLSVYKRHRSLYFQPDSINKPQLQSLFSFSKFSAIAQTSEFFKYRTDSVFAGMLLGISSAAHFTLMAAIMDMLTQILTRFTSYWDTIIIRQVGEGQQQAALNTVMQSLQIGLALSLLAALNTFLLGETFLSIWAGEKYGFLSNALSLFSLILIGSSFQMATTPYFNAMEKQRENAFIALTEILAKLALLIPFTRWFGFEGIIYASLCSSIGASLLLRLPLLARLAKTRLTTLLLASGKALAPVLLIAGGVLIFYLFMDKQEKFSLRSLAIIFTIQLGGILFTTLLRKGTIPKPWKKSATAMGTSSAP